MFLGASEDISDEDILLFSSIETIFFYSFVFIHIRK